ncbi:MAG: hypothetical protein DYH20_09550 [Gammaproteobacteria bacterium PRO9]|nr:hypothetical protein [Gammaproteobacteria bacterium PRO9]
MSTELEFVKRLHRDDRGSWPKMNRDSVLTPGEVYQEPTWPTIRVRVLTRFFLGGGQLAEPGTVIALVEPEARDAIALKRAEAV